MKAIPILRILREQHDVSMETITIPSFYDKQKKKQQQVHCIQC
jgi:hypothetical protein